MYFLCLIKILSFIPILHINSSSHIKNSTDHGARSLAVSGSSRKLIRSENRDKCDIKSGCEAHHSRGLSLEDEETRRGITLYSPLALFWSKGSFTFTMYFWYEGRESPRLQKICNTGKIIACYTGKIIPCNTGEIIPCNCNTGKLIACNCNTGKLIACNCNTDKLIACNCNTSMIVTCNTCKIILCNTGEIIPCNCNTGKLIACKCNTDKLIACNCNTGKIITCNTR